MRGSNKEGLTVEQRNSVRTIDSRWASLCLSVSEGNTVFLYLTVMSPYIQLDHSDIIMKDVETTLYLQLFFHVCDPLLETPTFLLGIFKALFEVGVEKHVLTVQVMWYKLYLVERTIEFTSFSASSMVESESFTLPFCGTKVNKWNGLRYLKIQTQFSPAYLTIAASLCNCYYPCDISYKWHYFWLLDIIFHVRIIISIIQCTVVPWGASAAECEVSSLTAVNIWNVNISWNTLVYLSSLQLVLNHDKLLFTGFQSGLQPLVGGHSLFIHLQNYQESEFTKTSSRRHCKADNFRFILFIFRAWFLVKWFVQGRETKGLMTVSFSSHACFTALLSTAGYCAFTFKW